MCGGTSTYLQKILFLKSIDALVEKLKTQGINILEQTSISGGRRVCFFEGPDGVQLEFIEMKA
jgi:catechol 2,3-dioxygenase-like lactoylglutathione lyase family enzyme